MAEPEPKKRKGRGITAPHRHRADGTYDSRPNDPDYFRKYYKERIKRNFPCPTVEQTSATQHTNGDT
jgi:hypothetical protein